MTEYSDDAGSAPCFEHLVVDGQIVDPETALDVARFRKGERARLYETRRALSVNQRLEGAAIVASLLWDEMGDVSGVTIGAYWPIRGELNLRGWIGEVHARGGNVALPVVVDRGEPVEFHEWTPDCAMKPGFWNIPVPEIPRKTVPECVVVPLLGVDEDRFRLGNGGGYYDRTLARMGPDIKIIGVGYASCRLKTIFPMPWDIPVKRVILSDGMTF